MKSILLIGLGRFGRHMAQKFNELNCEVLAVDCQEECVNASLPYVTSAQIGDSTNEQFIASLGAVSYTHLDVYKRQAGESVFVWNFLRRPISGGFRRWQSPWALPRISLVRISWRRPGSACKAARFFTPTARIWPGRPPPG